jgi:hypothetical protein
VPSFRSDHSARPRAVSIPALYRHRAYGPNFHPIQGFKEIIQDDLPVQTEIATEATPEGSTDTLQNALLVHIVYPAFRTMVFRLG